MLENNPIQLYSKLCATQTNYFGIHVAICLGEKMAGDAFKSSSIYEQLWGCEILRELVVLARGHEVHPYLLKTSGILLGIICLAILNPLKVNLINLDLKTIECYKYYY